MRNVALDQAQLTAKQTITEYSSLKRPVIIGLLLAVGYYLGAKIGFALTFHPHAVSTLWPPNSILLAGLLLTPKRWWWFLLLLALPAHLIIQLNTGVPLGMVLCWFVSNCCEALIGAGFLTYATKGRVGFDTSGKIALFIFAAIIAPFLSSFLDAGFVVLNAWGAGSYWLIWRMRFFSNVLAELTLVPFIVMWSQDRLSGLEKWSVYRVVEAGALIISLLVVGLLVLGGRVGEDPAPALLYTPVPLLMWAAVRFGPKGISTSLVAVTFLAIWGAVNGLGPFVTKSPEENALSVQFFLILVSLPLMTLAAVIQEQKHLREVSKHAEEQLRERNRQIRALAGRLISVQESERRRVSRELHDELSQRVAAIAIAISRLKRTIPAAEREIISELDGLYRDTNDLTGHIRQLSHELHPAALEHLGLEKALAAYINQFEREEGVETAFVTRLNSKSISFEISVCLYRIAVEGLRNIAKHAEAKSASISLAQHGNSLILEVIDFGRGFDIETARTGQGLGLISAEERVRLLQGTFVIESDSNSGTKLTATVPLG